MNDQEAPQRIEPPKPGIYPDVPAETYHLWDAFSYSQAKLILKCPAKLRWKLDHPEDDSTFAKEQGHASHDCCLLPEKFNAQYVRNVDASDHPGALHTAENLKAILRTLPSKMALTGTKTQLIERLQDARPDIPIWDVIQGDFNAQHQDKIILPTEEYDRCMAMREALMENEVAAMLMDGRGANEVSIVAKDPETGIICKHRSDRVTEYMGMSAHVDYKTTRSADPESFWYDARKYGYHMQAASYLDGYHILKGGERTYFLVCQEKDPPYASAVFTMEDEIIASGHKRWRRALNRYRECLDKNQWPSYGGPWPLLFTDYDYEH